MTHGFDEILKRRKRGSLKIYLGYAAGVGKTFAMLQEAHRLKTQGYDVIVGYLEPHERPDTLREMGGLEVLPRKRIRGGGIIYEEMDLEAILLRRPQIVLIDELAHTNSPGVKNEKRFQDVLEILDHRINVISTMNVQHLESVAEKVVVVTGVEVRERVPDYILERADQIVNVDVTIDELRERLRTGKIYKLAQAELALQRFFTHENLSMLRETALKEAAGDQIRRIEQSTLFKDQAAFIHETVMVALGAKPEGAVVLIRKGARFAAQLSSKWYVVYVQRRGEHPVRIDAALQRKLQNNLKLAQTLGAEVVTLPGDDVSQTLVNFAQEHNVRHALFSKPSGSPFSQRLRGSILLEFLHDSVGIDVHVVSLVE